MAICRRPKADRYSAFGEDIMKLFLIRHGQTLWNVEERCQGFSDIELDEVGIRQAQAIARALRPEPLEAVYSSPLRRALVTAQYVAAPHGLEVVTDAGLMEINQGEFEGLTMPELRKHGEFLREWFLRPATLRIPGGESMAEVQDRAWAAVERMWQAHPNGVVAAVGHNLANITILCRAVGLALNDFRRLRQSVASISSIEMTEQGCTLTSLNQEYHLRALCE